MSWWDEGDDVLGDKPADKLKGAWRMLYARWRDHGAALPKTEDVLQSYVSAAKSANIAVPPLTRMVMWRERERLHEFDGSTAIAEIKEAFVKALQQIAQDYQYQVSRPPRASELVKTLEFIVSAAPQDYFADGTPEEWTNVWLQAS